MFIAETERQRKIQQDYYEAKSMFCLQPAHADTFRIMKEQGLGIECFVPLFNAYLLGTFTLNWWPLENLLCLMLSIHIFYLRTFCGVRL